MNDLSVGVSYATENRITLNLEYHLHQAGFSPEDWSHWFNTSAQRGFIPGVNAALWYLRSYAQDQQEPIERHAAFVRLDWQDAFVTDLELTALATVNLQDASGLLAGDRGISRVIGVDGRVPGGWVSRWTAL